MEEFIDNLEEDFQFIKVKTRKPFCILDNEIILNTSLDYYTLGVYTKLQSLCEINGDWEDLYKYGSKEYVNKALKRLEENNLLHFKDGKLYL